MNDMIPPSIVEWWQSFEFDGDLLRFFQYGLAIGICLTTGLALFPGRDEESLAAKKEEHMEQSLKSSETADKIDTKENVNNGSVGTNGNHTNEFLSTEEEELMRRIIKQRRGQGEGGWTPHQQMNYAVYVLLFSVAFLILIYSYDVKGSFLQVWLVHHFPREASALGFSSPSGTKK